MNTDNRQAPPKAYPTPVPPGSDLLLQRNRAAILASILADRTGWAPDWQPAPGGVGHGLADIFAGHLELLQQRLSQVPDHRAAVMLDQLGVSQLPAQGARTHVLLTGIPGTPGARVPAGTRIGASVPGRDTPVVFETRDTVAITSATIVEAHSVLPAEDAEHDHSADLLAHRPVNIFADALPVERHLYVGHDTVLAFDGRAVVELEIGLAVAAPAPLALDWAWWDGHDWREFTALAASPQDAGADDSIDGTSGLTRSGTIRLVAPCATSAPLDIDGRTSCWIRGRLAAPLHLHPGSPPPTISRVRLRVVNEHRRLMLRRTTEVGAGASLRIWWPEVPKTAKIQRYLLPDQNTATSKTETAQNDNTLIALPGTLTGHSIQIGVSHDPSRDPIDSGMPPANDPRQVAFKSPEELTDPQIADPGTVFDVTVAAGLVLDKAIADQREADLSKTFAPLGPAPVRGTAFLFANETATKRPGSRVTLVLERPVTAAEEADGLSGKQEGSVQAAQELIASLIKKLEDGPGSALETLASAKNALDPPLPTLLSTDPTVWYAGVRSTIQTALTALKAAAGPNHAIWGQVGTARQKLDEAIAAADAKPSALGARTALELTPKEIARVLLGIASAAGQLADGGSAISLQRTALETAITNGSDADVTAAVLALNGPLGALLGAASPFLPAGARASIFAMDPVDFENQVKARINGAKSGIGSAITAVQSVRDTLKNLNPTDLVKGVLGTSTTQLTAPVVAWEYHDGSRWRALGVKGDAQVLALQASGSLRFTVPSDMAEVDIDGDVRRWMRARLAAGSFSHLRLVSWTDKSGVLNFLPVVEPRAPMLDSIQVFYQHRSDALDPGGVIIDDNHDWRDLTRAVTWPGPGASPFLPMLETAPTLYLGFDGDLPADRISIWMQRAAGSMQEPSYRPIWEGFDGNVWVRLATDDGTDGLRRTGIVGLIWPGTTGTPGVTVSEARGTRIALEGPGAALRFAPGEQLLLTDLQGQEPIVVSSVAGETVTCRFPVSRAYTGGQLRPSPPARFGVPRTWVRAVFDRTRPAPLVTLTGLAAHAVEIEQAETIHDELIGSGDGSPSQMLMSRRSPVAADPDLEVRELDGDRADLDHDALERTLQADGVDPQRVRLVYDQGTGRVSEVWVPWTPVPSLGSAGPTDRVYVVDHAQGRFIFGGLGHGRALPEGRDNTRLRTYRTCDGAMGNVQAHVITQLLSAVAVGGVTNPEGASGGADIEPLPAALIRGPALLRHRRLALTQQDVEAVAVECSPAVVRARAVGAKDRFGRPSAGEVRVVIVPRDGAARPQPGAALLALVRAAIVNASPAVAARHVTVEGPQYVPVGIAATVLPVAANDAGPVRERAQSTLESFMHPLNGGFEGRGWEFGRSAYISDIARVIESVPGVDTVENLVLTRDDVPAGDAALIRADQVLCAGRIVIRLGGGA
ncbi:baseplate J/gp47 family protein [Arthrobacter oryzae]|uniref:baseplate J/gp47 family protein n=1 Tax=Arthrobacter oryzae TaxID=409290 RepID=UPI00278632BF|nr:baseplate J/gp47 family protein [Arthrobacter oryzae]MDQ0079502.1 hypothetical protein [Arthrobacter oryzae]